MLKTYKLEVKLTKEQQELYKQYIGINRYLYNKYIETNKNLYEQYKNGEIAKNQCFLSGYDFDKYVNNELSKDNLWIKGCPAKSRKKAIMNAETSFKRFFKGLAKFPRFKRKKNDYHSKLYHVTINKIERHKLNLPKLGWVHLKEYSYLPKDITVKSFTLSTKANKYYISILTEVNQSSDNQANERTYVNGIGIDLGIKDLMICSNGKVYKNINKSFKLRKLYKQLAHLQRNLSRKFQNRKVGAIVTYKNIDKATIKLRKKYTRISNIVTDYINKSIAQIISLNPQYITLEDLNVSGMLKNKHLSKHIKRCRFYEIRTKLLNKCLTNGIEFRQVDRWYPSSKLCSCCGHIKKDLKLKDRNYICDSCGTILDRDYNASVNLAQAKEYKIIH